MKKFKILILKKFISFFPTPYPIFERDKHNQILRFYIVKYAQNSLVFYSLFSKQKIKDMNQISFFIRDK